MMLFKYTFIIALVAITTADGAERSSLLRHERTPSNEAAVTEDAASNMDFAEAKFISKLNHGTVGNGFEDEDDLELWEASKGGALKGSSKKSNNSPRSVKGVAVAKGGAGCSVAEKGQTGGSCSYHGQAGTCRCRGGCVSQVNGQGPWSDSLCEPPRRGGFRTDWGGNGRAIAPPDQRADTSSCTDDDYCSDLGCLISKCMHWCSCDYNGEKDHKEEEESFKLREGDGRFKGREANSYNGEGGHQEEGGNFKPVEEDGRFEGGEDGNYSKDEDHKKEESNSKPVEDEEETASK